MEYKYDLHLHCHEGSPDSKIILKEAIKEYINLGYSGLLLTDHNSYNGYKHFKEELLKHYPHFHLLKGIEYDTADAGHIIVILPTNHQSDLSQGKGLTLDKLIEIVHKLGGILGPAHPFHEPFLAIFKTSIYKNNFEILKKLDFIEGFNACEHHEDNLLAQEIAKDYDIPAIAGSDGHHSDMIGLATTIFNEEIKDEDDLINYIKHKKEIIIKGTRYGKSTRDRLGPFNKVLVYGFYLLNKIRVLINLKQRKNFVKKH